MHSEEVTGVPNEQHAKERIQLFETQGYRTLVIWEHEFQELESVKKRIKEFCDAR